MHSPSLTKPSYPQGERVADVTCPFSSSAFPGWRPNSAVQGGVGEKAQAYMCPHTWALSAVEGLTPGLCQTGTRCLWPTADPACCLQAPPGPSVGSGLVSPLPLASGSLTSWSYAPSLGRSPQPGSCPQPFLYSSTRRWG